MQAALIVADRHQSLQITGNGDVLEPHDGIIAIGSGSPYCLAAARALIDQPGMDALAIGKAGNAAVSGYDASTSIRVTSSGRLSTLPCSSQSNADCL
jgi:ATP-dependent protease HslVU (ClpYQ) peptidase subunit